MLASVTKFIQEKPVETITLLFAAIAIWISILSWIAAKRQAVAAEKQATEATNSRKIAEESISAQAEALKLQASESAKDGERAERSARAAEEAARVAQGAFESISRAWITHSFQIDTGSVETGIPTSVFVTVKNEGRRPAIDLVISVRFEELTTLPASNSTLLSEDAAPYQVIGPGAVQQMTLNLKSGVGIDVNRGRTQLLFQGQVKYRDAFNKDRETRWGYHYNVLRSTFEPLAGFNHMS